MKYPDMSSYIRHLQQSRGMSLQDLSRLLGYSSPTSLTRLMQQSANRSSLIQFAQRMRACSALQLSRWESNLLDDLIELHDIGSDFETMVALRRLLRGEPVLTAPLELYDSAGNRSSFLGHFASRRIRKMVLLNSEHVGFFHELALLMEQGDFAVDHVLYSGDSSLHTVNSVRNALPLLYCERYNSYTYRLESNPAVNTRGIILSDLLLYSYDDEQGGMKYEVIIFTSASRGEVQQVMTKPEDVRRFLPPSAELKKVCQRIRIDDLMQYNEFCADLERDRMVCTIKSDLCLTELPIDVLRQAIVDQATPMMQQLLPALEYSFAQRQRNMLEKFAPQYHIFRRSAMRRFVQTGMLSDHLWCCRPFRVDEIMSILRYVRFTLMEMSNVHFCFLKDDDALCCDEIVYYQDRGLSIIRPDADHRPGDTVSEVLITEPELLKVFQRFITESTLRYRVDTEENAALFIEELMNECGAELMREIQPKLKKG